MATEETIHRRAAGRTGVLMVALLALVVRWVVLWQTRDVPFVQHPVGDARGYLEWAGRIAGGEWMGSEAFYQSPLYAYVLGVVLKVSGCGTSGIRILQACWGATACGFLGWGTTLLWGRRAGLCAGVLAAFYGPAIYYDGLIQKASLDGLLASALFAACAASARTPSGLRFLCVGLLTGLASLNRENALIWIPILVLWVWFLGGTWRSRRTMAAKEPVPYGRGSDQGGSVSERLRVSAALLFGVACVLGPVTIRNGVIGGVWSVTTYQAGSNFYIGNSRTADGRYRPLVRGHETPEFERADATRLAEAAEGRTLSPGEVSRYWFARAWEDIRGDAGRWVRLLVKKFGIVWNRYEVPDVEGLAVYADESFVLRWVSSFWHFGLLCPLAVVGACTLTWCDRRRVVVGDGPPSDSSRFRADRTIGAGIAGDAERVTRFALLTMILSMSLSVSAFFVLGRYRHSVAVMLLPFASVGLIALADALRTRGSRRRGWAVPALPEGGWRQWWAVPTLLVAAAVNWPVRDEWELDAYVLMNAGVALAQAGSLDRATDYFARTVEAIPESAEANNNLAQALALGREFRRAIPYYERALNLAADLPGAEYNLAVALEEVGRVGDAAMHYERASRAEPDNVEAARALARLRRATMER